ncbi:MAG: hypothetical protein IMW99_01945 [Firmicutes bacterium]|nr:hypothetical protein [Bacillota bacterium]
MGSMNGVNNTQGSSPLLPHTGAVHGLRAGQDAAGAALTGRHHVCAIRVRLELSPPLLAPGMNPTGDRQNLPGSEEPLPGPWQGLLEELLKQLASLQEAALQLRQVILALLDRWPATGSPAAEPAPPLPSPGPPGNSGPPGTPDAPGAPPGGNPPAPPRGPRADLAGVLEQLAQAWNGVVSLLEHHSDRIPPGLLGKMLAALGGAGEAGSASPPGQAPDPGEALGPEKALGPLVADLSSGRLRVDAPALNRLLASLANASASDVTATGLPVPAAALAPKSGPGQVLAALLRLASQLLEIVGFAASSPGSAFSSPGPAPGLPWVSWLAPGAWEAAPVMPPPAAQAYLNTLPQALLASQAFAQGLFFNALLGDARPPAILRRYPPAPPRHPELRSSGSGTHGGAGGRKQRKPRRQA